MTNVNEGAGMTRNPDHLLLGKPFVSDDDSAPDIETANRELAELESIGLVVTRIHQISNNVPLRYFLEFPRDVMQYVVRGQLEKKLFDVGQKMGAGDLSFYASKRVKQTKGWDE